MLHLLCSLTPNQRSAVIASYLSWTLDAFDFSILGFVLKDVAKEFGSDVTTVSYAIFFTLAARPIGALIAGLAADRYGRRATLMAVILVFSVFGFASGLAPSLTIFLLLRLAFGVAMGGEWGVGAALAMETIPAQARGLVSGILQTGYPSGFLLAAITYLALFGLIGWRGMFMVGALPTLLLVWYIRAKVEESPAFLIRAGRHAAPARASLPRLADVRVHVGRFLYAMLLMTAFNFLSHGTQDLYPTFLQVQRGFAQGTVGPIVIVSNVGAIFGGLSVGALSQRAGRRRAILIAALLTLPVIPFWAYGTGPVMLAAGAFLMGFAVQGAWGVVPAHLNELSPGALRGTFPGFAYQLGNLLASPTAPIQASIAQENGGNYAFALASVTAIAAVTLAVLAAFGKEAHGIDFVGD
jgi:MFS transporter, SHS family, lactate transporter